jgi:phosphatidate cytidylyltransferase
VTPLDAARVTGSSKIVPSKSEMVKRVASALVLAAIALGAVVTSPWTFALLVVAAGAAVTWEWGRLVRGIGLDGIAIVQATAIAAVAILVTLGHPGFTLIALVCAGGLVSLASLSSGKLVWSLAGLACAALPAWGLVWLRSDSDLGVAALLYLFAVAWTTDTASYVAGTLMGGPKLAPSISPHKTWSGLIVGILAPALIGSVFALALKGTSGLRLALVSVAIAVACQIGDLSESALKRRFGAKDMSHLIPGHGGLLDRIDGLLIAALAAALFALRDPASPGRGLLMW